jgi:ectoine hydroxylase-related dioxygenase (phytanoyl-CoA dioxygenase family)
LKNGFVILKNIFSKTEVELALSEMARLEALKSGPASQGGRNSFEGFQTRRMYAGTILDKSRSFDVFCMHPTILALNDYFLQKHYLLTAVQTINILPGSPSQQLHTDDGLISLPRPRPLFGVGTMIALDDFTDKNGATVLIPGSHLWPDARAPRIEEAKPVVMPAGSMCYFLNTVWHGGGANVSEMPRKAMTVQVCSFIIMVSFPGVEVVHLSLLPCLLVPLHIHFILR